MYIYTYTDARGGSLIYTLESKFTTNVLAKL